MGAKEKRKQERLEGINKRKREVLEAAKLIFAEKTIEKATMQDIAEEAEVGVASVYRYYSTKLDLVMEVALDYHENQYAQIDTVLHGTGIEQASQVFDYLSKKFIENPAMLMFMEQLDSFVLSCEKGCLTEDVYDKIVNKNNEFLIKLIEKGIKDGSIRMDIKAKEIGNTCVELLMSLGQKLIIRNKLLKSKTQIDTFSTISLYKEILIKYLSSA